MLERCERGKNCVRVSEKQIIENTELLKNYDTSIFYNKVFLTI